MYWENVVEMLGVDVDSLGVVVGNYKVYLVIGVVEWDEVYGIFYCSMLYFGFDGSLLY